MSDTIGPMKSLTIELPDELAARIEAEAVQGKTSISDVVRKHLKFADSNNPRSALGEAITDVVRSAVTEPLPHAERSRDNALFDAIKKVVRSAEQLADAGRSPHPQPLPHAQLGAERSPRADPLRHTDPLLHADPLPDPTFFAPRLPPGRRRAQSLDCNLRTTQLVVGQNTDR